MKCCAECFGDRGLRKNIIPLRSDVGDDGCCDYCKTDGVRLIEPSRLNEYFDLLLTAYRRDDDNGKPFTTWLREDWSLFENPQMDESRAKDLLAEIFDDGEIVLQKFSPANDLNIDPLGDWEKLREELMYHNRFFPKADIDEERLRELLSPLTLEAGEVTSHWFRARIQEGDAEFPISEMGAPPNRVATHGRANPAGIPYLYLGSEPITSIAETRPHTGDRVCVADFQTPDDIKLVDLRKPRRMVSPFLLEDSIGIGRMRSDLPFLERLGDELTRPVLPQLAAIEYTPSQYLCEFIKNCGYDGVIYRSSVSEGMNLALFDPALAVDGGVVQYEVTRVSVDAVTTPR